MSGLSWRGMLSVPRGVRSMSDVICYRANPVVSCGEEPDGALLFNPDTDDAVLVNVSGRRLWRFLESPRTVEAMSMYLGQAYRDVSIERAREDVVRFVQALTPDFLLEVTCHD